MADKITAAMFVVVGIIHLLPLSGVLGAERLASLYDVDLCDPNLLLLMQHRAVLFGLLGGLFVAAAFVPGLRIAAFAMAAISVGSFFVLAGLSSGLNAALMRVVWVDVVAAVALIVALVCCVFFGARS